MAELDVQIVRLKPMRVVWVREVGPDPEQQAWSKLRAWAESRGLLGQPMEHPVFGFNNPAAAPGAGEYGYEMWIAAEAEPGEDVAIKEFPGGLYATTSCRLVGGAGVAATWKALLRWVHMSQYTWRRSTHELERIEDPTVGEEQLVLTLHLPIEG